jgi:hypothetical protein
MTQKTHLRTWTRRSRTGRLTILCLLALLAAATAASPADAARRKVPFGFFGTMLTNWQSGHIPDSVLDAQMAMMARSGVESVRIVLPWNGTEPAQGVFNFSTTDRLVAAAARHRLDVLPTVLYTPRWASSNPSSAHPELYAPTNPQLYANFMRVLIGRYGPRGSFWAVSNTPRVPIRNWQIWNGPPTSSGLRVRGIAPTCGSCGPPTRRSMRQTAAPQSSWEALLA